MELYLSYKFILKTWFRNFANAMLLSYTLCPLDWYVLNINFIWFFTISFNSKKWKWIACCSWFDKTCCFLGCGITLEFSREKELNREGIYLHTYVLYIYKMLNIQYIILYCEEICYEVLAYVIMNAQMSNAHHLPCANCRYRKAYAVWKPARGKSDGVEMAGPGLKPWESRAPRAEEQDSSCRY
jgi:hypothetical protein